MTGRRARSTGLFTHPSWCRRDLCDETTSGLQIDHRSSDFWSRVLDAEPERRLNIAVERADSRHPSGRLIAGPLTLHLGVDAWNPDPGPDGELLRTGTWLPDRGGFHSLTLADAHDLARHLDALVALCQDSEHASSDGGLTAPDTIGGAR